MSIPGLALGLSAIEAGGIILLQSLHTNRPRSIGGYEAQITVEEDHHDQMRITDHPVEQGAAITDHAYKMPATVTIRCGWSNSPSPKKTGLIDIPANLVAGLASTLAAFTGQADYVRDVYTQLLGLQAAAEPFTILTAKRTYVDMLIESLTTMTNRETENSLMIVAVCKQVILVNTEIVSVPAAAQALPQETQGVQSVGTVSPSAAPDFNPVGK